MGGEFVSLQQKNLIADFSLLPPHPGNCPPDVKQVASFFSCLTDLKNDELKVIQWKGNFVSFPLSESLF